jgi:hypothetical protein
MEVILIVTLVGLMRDQEHAGQLEAAMNTASN